MENVLDQIFDLVINKLSIFWFLGTFFFVKIFYMQNREKTRLHNFIRLRGYRPDFEFIENGGRKFYETKIVDQEIQKELIDINNKSQSLGLEFKDDGFSYYLLRDSKEIAQSDGLDVISFKLSEIQGNK